MTILTQVISKNVCTSGDTHLHTWCLAALSNLSIFVTNVHHYAANRVTILTKALSKKYKQLKDTFDQSNKKATSSSPLLRASQSTFRKFRKT